MTRIEAGQRELLEVDSGSSGWQHERDAHRYPRLSPMAWTAEMARYLLLRSALAFFDFSPRAVAAFALNALAVLDTALTARGRSGRIEARLQFGMSSSEAFRMTWRWISVSYMDMYEMRRVATGREDLTKWTIEEVNTSWLRERIEQRQAVLVVGGHFSMGAMLGTSEFTPDAFGTGVLAPVEPFKLRGDVLMRRLIRGTLEKLAQVLRPDTAVVAYAGTQDVQSMILDSMERGGAGAMLVDVWWKKENAIRLPFAGWKEMPLPPGAPRIARLAQAPIAVTVAERLGPRAVRLHCSQPIWPGEREDRASDREVMARIVAELDPFVGKLRHQYPHPIGWGRRWNQALERWEDLED